MTPSREIARLFAYGGLFVGVFVPDALTPLGLNVPILYLLPLLLAFLVEHVRTRVALTILATLLTAGAVSVSAKWDETWLFGITDRLFDLGVFWVALALSIRDARTTGELPDLRHALDTAAIVAITGPDGILRHMNDRFCQISKYSWEELIGRDLRTLEFARKRQDSRATSGRRSPLAASGTASCAIAPRMEARIGSTRRSCRFSTLAASPIRT